MKRLLALLLFAGAHAHAAPFAIAHVAVVDVEHGTIARDRFVVVDDGRIAAIGDESVVPRGGRRIDGSGGWLVPGFVDMHVHLFNNASKRAPNDWALPLFVANGVTGVREMAARVEDVPQVRRWNASVERGELVAPRVLATGVPMSCGAGADVAAQVGAIAAAGAFAKVFSEVDAACWKAIADAVSARSVAIAGHVPAAVPALDAARGGLRSDEHLMQLFEACSAGGDVALEGRAGLAGMPLTALRDVQEPSLLATFDAPRCTRVAHALARTGQAQVPTLVLPRSDLAPPADPAADARWPRLRADEQARWRRFLGSGFRPDPALAKDRDRVALAIVRSLHDANVPIMAGTDAPMPNVYPGWSLHDELALLVAAGLSPADALRAATIAPARFLGIERDAGTIAVGRRADLVLLDANPLADIAATRRIRVVVLAGRVLDRRALDGLAGAHE